MYTNVGNNTQRNRFSPVRGWSGPKLGL